MKYRLVEKSSTPGVKNLQAKKFYASPKTDRALDVRAFAKLATADASISVGDMENALDLFGRTAMQQLLQGHSVEIPDIGSLRITFRSEGVTQPEDFRSQSMIRSARIVFTPRSEIRSALTNGLSFELSGVRAGGHDYTSVAEYRKQTGTALAPSSGGTTPTPDPTGGDDEN